MRIRMLLPNDLLRDMHLTCNVLQWFIERTAVIHSMALKLTFKREVCFRDFWNILPVQVQYCDPDFASWYYKPLS
jgi:hypothetical protein